MVRSRIVNYPKVARCFKDAFKTSLKSVRIDPDTWEVASQDQTAWRTTLRKGAATYGESRTLAAEQRRLDRITREVESSPETKDSLF